MLPLRQFQRWLITLRLFTTRQLDFRAVLLTLMMALSAWIWSGCGEDNTAKRLTLFDRTGSSSGSDDLCRENALAWAKQHYDGIDGERGQVRVDAFNVENDTSLDFNTKVDFKVEPKDTSSPKRIEKAIDARLEELSTKVRDLLASRPSGGSTDMIAMLAGLGEAAKAVGAEEAWVCSDTFDARIQDEPTPENARRVVDSLDQDSLPDLKGLKIVLDTSSAAGLDNLDATALAAIRLFNKELIRRSGGQLAGYGPGAGTV